MSSVDTFVKGKFYYDFITYCFYFIFIFLYRKLLFSLFIPMENFTLSSINYFIFYFWSLFCLDKSILVLTNKIIFILKEWDKVFNNNEETKKGGFDEIFEENF